MATVYTQPVQVLIDELGRLPGIGPKSAQRIAFHLLKIPADDVARLALAITEAKQRVRFCSRCWNSCCCAVVECGPTNIPYPPASFAAFTTSLSRFFSTCWRSLSRQQRYVGTFGRIASSPR